MKAGTYRNVTIGLILIVVLLGSFFFFAHVHDDQLKEYNCTICIFSASAAVETAPVLSPISMPTAIGIVALIELDLDQIACFSDLTLRGPPQDLQT
jgi:hypothetical protein